MGLEKASKFSVLAIGPFSIFFEDLLLKGLQVAGDLILSGRGQAGLAFAIEFDKFDECMSALMESG